MSNENVVLVTGATGNVGRHIVSQLLREGTASVTRSPKSAGLLREVDVVRGDLAATETLDPVAKGADAASFSEACRPPALHPLSSSVGDFARRIEL